MSQNCENDCARCRAIEAGFYGRGLTPREFIDTFGTVEIERVDWETDETKAAAIDRDAAHVEYEAANAVVGEIIGRISEGERNLDSVLAAATQDRDEAGEVLRSARRTYNALAARDSRARQVAEYEADQAAQSEARKASSGAARRTLIQRFKEGVRA